MIMKHFQEELEETGNTMRKIREETENKNLQLIETNERIMYGGIMFSFKSDFGGLFVRKNHISFEFGFGVYMDDPYNVLEGSGKLRRHLKIRSLADIEDKKVDFFVKQAL